MTRKLPKVRYIKRESILIGDHLRISFMGKDGIRRSREGTVAKRDRVGRVTTFYTKEGGELLTYHDFVTSSEYRITLLNRNPDLALFDENVLE